MPHNIKERDDTNSVSDDPFRGYKYARLIIAKNKGTEHKNSPSTTARFAGLTASDPEHYYNTTAVARCIKDPLHRRPRKDCDCGFHAVLDKEYLDVPYPGSPADYTIVLLDVELTELVQVHEFGLRGQTQEVLAVHFSNKCASCSGPASYIVAKRAAPATTSCTKCKEHWDQNPYAEGVYTPAELSGLLKTEVVLDRPIRKLRVLDALAAAVKTASKKGSPYQKSTWAKIAAAGTLYLLALSAAILSMLTTKAKGANVHVFAHPQSAAALYTALDVLCAALAILLAVHIARYCLRKTQSALDAQSIGQSAIPGFGLLSIPLLGSTVEALLVTIVLAPLALAPLWLKMKPSIGITRHPDDHYTKPSGYDDLYDL